MKTYSSSYRCRQSWANELVIYDRKSRYFLLDAKKEKFTFCFSIVLSFDLANASERITSS